ncbi:GNAT family N-acetyltransferase [Acinetobacter schindleri]|uniref:GNAT family N-acetyltransferase n=1 Tax=Acinetobacter schindleri TaxID=108981 RepID=UPI003F55A0BF
MLISAQEQDYILKSMEQYISSTLGYTLEKLRFPIDFGFTDPEGTARCTLFFCQDLDDIYLRFRCYEGEKFIEIAKVGFNKVKNGNGTALLLTLLNIAEKYEYERIFIESPNENSTAFAEKLGFDKTMNITPADLKLSLKVRSMKL